MTYLLLLVVLAAVAFYLVRQSRARPALPPPDAAARFTLQEGLARFAEIGLHLAPGVTEREVAISWQESDDPWWMLFFVYGIEIEEEPWGRRISEDVWNFDHEAIDSPDAYEDIVRRHVGLTGDADLLRLATLEVAGTGDGAMTLVVEDRSGTSDRIPAVLRDDWADGDALVVLRALIRTKEGSGRRFWCADNGQAEVLAYLTDDQAAHLNALRPGLVHPA